MRSDAGIDASRHVGAVKAGAGRGSSSAALRLAVFRAGRMHDCVGGIDCVPQHLQHVPSSSRYVSVSGQDYMHDCNLASCFTFRARAL